MQVENTSAKLHSVAFYKKTSEKSVVTRKVYFIPGSITEIPVDLCEDVKKHPHFQKWLKEKILRIVLPPTVSEVLVEDEEEAREIPDSVEIFFEKKSKRKKVA